MTTSTRADAAPSRLQHARGALAHSLSGFAWRRALEVRSADATVAASLRVGLATAIVLIGFGAVGPRELAGLAVLGALSSAFARHEPYLRVAAKVALIGVLLVVFAIGGALLALAHQPLWAQIVVMSLGAGIAAAVVTAFRITGPGPVILVFAATAAVGYASSPADLVRAAAATGVGALVALATTLLPGLVLPMGPARLAVARALAAASEVASEGSDGAILAARVAITNAREKLALSGAARRRSVDGRDLAAVVDETEAGLDDWVVGDGDRLRAVVRHERELRKLKRRSEIAGPDSEVLALPSPARFVPVGLSGLRNREVLVNAVRIAAASVLAGWFAAAAGLEHPLWASMGAMAAMQGMTFGHTVQRAIQRLVGNVGGGVIAAVLIAATLGYWPSVVVIVVLQVVAELMAVRNYALTSLALTPMALLLVGLGADVGPELGLSRVVDTLIGVVVGVLVAAVTISRSDRQHLPQIPCR